MTIGPEDLETSGRFLDLLLQMGKWAAGTAAAAWVAIKWTVRAGMVAGEEKRRYQEMEERVAALEEANFITKPQHDDMQRICQSNLERMISDRLHKAILEWRDELAVLNANVCHIMGALNINPVDQGKRRRRVDIETGD
jgi:hypothetical protein